MSAPREPQDDLIADLEDEAATLRGRNTLLEMEVKSLRRDLRHARRNLGYRIVDGISRVFKPFPRIFRNGAVSNIQFPRVRHAAGNGSAAPPCSEELKRLAALLGQGVQSVFFSSPTPRNWALHKLLLRKGTRHLCFDTRKFERAITKNFFGVPDQPVSRGDDRPAFAHYELIVIDCDHPGALWPLLKGRFWPHQKLLLHGKSNFSEVPANETGPDFAFYGAPPPPWLDPRHTYLPAFAPWKSNYQKLPAKLPNGHAWPRISVVTPSFNQGKFIGDTFESVLVQIYPNLEYLVFDGGSTDETRAMLDRYRPRLSYSCSEKDNGQADAINKGFARATGDILAWLNSDDQYSGHTLMNMALAFDLFPEADIVVGGCGLLPGTGSAMTRIHHCALPIGKVVPLPLEQLLDLDNCWLKGHFFYQPEVFWRRRIWEAVGARVADDLFYSFDYDLWVRMAKAGAKIVHIPDLVAIYRVHPGQKTYGDNLPYLPELRDVNRRHTQPV